MEEKLEEIKRIPEKRKIEEEVLEPFQQVEQWIVLKAKKKKLERELEAVENRILNLEKEYPLVGNLKGMIKKASGKKTKKAEAPPEKKQKTEPAKTEKEKNLERLEKLDEKERGKSELQKIRESPSNLYRIVPTKKEQEILERNRRGKPGGELKEKDFMED